MSLADIEFKEILKYAYTLYRKRCVGVHRKEVYIQFAKDFVNLKRYVNCHHEVVCMNIHNVNFHRIIRLFIHNGGLVRKYFDKDSFTEVDCDNLATEFLMNDQDSAVNVVNNPHKVRDSSHTTFDCYLSDEQIAIITEGVNKADVFTTHVSEAQIRQLFNCELPHPLTAKKIRSVVTVFHALMIEGVIKSNWQKVISDNGLILSPKTGKPLTNSNLSSALSEIKLEDKRGNNIIRQMARDVGRIKNRDEKEDVISEGT